MRVTNKLLLSAITGLILVAAPHAWGGPPAGDLPSADAPADGPAAEETRVIPSAISLRTQMEDGMSQIGELAVQARADADLVRATCVLDKQEKAKDVMELGTGELLVIGDGTTTEQSRQFATEKLDAAAARIDSLVEEAKRCAGRQGPEEEIDVTRNGAEEPRTIPIWDPTTGLGTSPVPPPVDGGWPPAASPVE